MVEISLGSIKARARRELQDLRAIRWKDDHLKEIILDSLASLAVLRPDYFIRSVVVELGYGEEHVVSCCDRIARVDGEIDSEGQIVSPVSKSSIRAETDYRRTVCKKKTSESFPTSYALDSLRPNVIRFGSPIPPGAKRKVRFWCTSPPTLTKNSDVLSVPAEAIADIHRMILSIAQGTESESAVSQGSSASNEARVYRAAATRKKITEDQSKVT